MRTSDRNSAFPESREDEISVLSWNLLAPSYDRYGLDWQGIRLPQLKLWLRRFVACDVMCFQEVDLGESLMALREFLSAHGYTAVVQERKGFPVVTATFFKASLFRLLWSQHRSRALIIGLALADGRELCVANVHLEAGGGERNENQRKAQLTSVLKRVSGNTIVCGDFNSDLTHGSQLHSKLVDSGLVRAPTRGFTLAQASGYADILDHIWASENLKACCVLGSSAQELDIIQATGIPNESHPSDHLPIAAMFGLKKSLTCEWHPHSLPIVQVPVEPNEEVRNEWLQICACAEVGGCKQAVREQKQLEAAFFEVVSYEEATHLCNWRTSANKAAKHVLSEAVKRAIDSIEPIPMAVLTDFDPVAMHEEKDSEHIHRELSFAGA